MFGLPLTFAAPLMSDIAIVDFQSPEYLALILLAFTIAMFNQMSGINAILYYAPEVMKKAGAFAVAKKVYDEARKPHNQAKIKQAVQKMQERRGAKRY